VLSAKRGEVVEKRRRYCIPGQRGSKRKGRVSSKGKDFACFGRRKKKRSLENEGRENVSADVEGEGEDYRPTSTVGRLIALFAVGREKMDSSPIHDKERGVSSRFSGEDEKKKKAGADLDWGGTALERGRGRSRFFRGGREGTGQQKRGLRHVDQQLSRKKKKKVF